MVSCPKHIDMQEGFILARQRAVERGAIPDELRKIRRSILETNNVYDVGRKERVSWAADLEIPKSGKTLFFSSCYYTATEDGRESLAMAVNLLRKMRVNISYLYDGEPCCGAPLHFYGFKKEFEEKVKMMSTMLKEKGVEEIITPSPTCAYTFKELYPKYASEFNIRTKTMVEVISENIKAKEISLKTVGSQNVVFQDPTFLSRFLGIIEEPREILRSIPGVNVVEPKYYWGANTMSDGDMSADEEVSSKMAQARLRQLVACDVKTIITASATDLQRLRKAAQTLGQGKIEIVDLIKFIGRALVV